MFGISLPQQGPGSRLYSTGLASFSAYSRHSRGTKLLDSIRGLLYLSNYPLTFFIITKYVIRHFRSDPFKIEGMSEDVWPLPLAIRGEQGYGI